MTRFVPNESLPILITNYTFQSNALERIFFIYPVFSHDRVLGYLDMNHSINETISSGGDNQLLHLLNKSTFNSVEFNCVIGSNADSGCLELTASRDIMPGELIVCWFNETYLKNIKSKLKISFFFGF